MDVEATVLGGLAAVTTLLLLRFAWAFQVNVVIANEMRWPAGSSAGPASARSPAPLATSPTDAPPAPGLERSPAKGVVSSDPPAPEAPPAALPPRPSTFDTFAIYGDEGKVWATINGCRKGTSFEVWEVFASGAAMPLKQIEDLARRLGFSGVLGEQQAKVYTVSLRWRGTAGIVVTAPEDDEPNWDVALLPDLEESSSWVVVPNPSLSPPSLDIRFLGGAE